MYETDARKLTQQVKDQSIELEKSQSKEPNKYSNNGNKCKRRRKRFMQQKLKLS